MVKTPGSAWGLLQPAYTRSVLTPYPLSPPGRGLRGSGIPLDVG
jgi:hypothetical protein